MLRSPPHPGAIDDTTAARAGPAPTPALRPDPAVAASRPRRATRPHRLPIDVATVLAGAVATVPEVQDRTTLVCDVTTASVGPRVLEDVVTTLLRVQTGLPASSRIWVTAVPASGGIVVTVEDDAATVARGAACPSSRSTTTLRLARVGQLARQHGGSAWVERGFDGGLCYAVELPGALACG